MSEAIVHATGWDVLMGRALSSDVGHDIRGAVNDYNARGRGSTMVRRVLREGSWTWVSPPAARGRYLAGDRKDVQRGPVYQGEVVAEYTLGRLRTPNAIYVVGATDADRVLISVAFARIKTGYRLTCGTETYDVSDPYWR